MSVFNKEKITDLIETVSKAELHVHIEGSMSLDLLNHIAKRKTITPPPENIYTFSSFEEFDAIFPVLRPFLMETEDFFDMTWSFAGLLKRSNVVYAEGIVMPFIHHFKGIPWEIQTEGLIEAARKVKEELDITLRYIAAVPRVFGLDAANWTFEKLKSDKSGCFIGLDLAGPEEPGTIRPFAKVWQKAGAEGYLTAAHAGEFGPVECVIETLNELKPARIGHGLSAAQDMSLMERLADENITLDISLSSNLLLGAVKNLEDHPLKIFFENGVPVTINTDDPAFFNTDLNSEYKKASYLLGDNPSVIKKLTDQSFISAHGDQSNMNKPLSSDD